MKYVIQYFWNILVWLDQGLNVLAAGDPDETVSSRCAKRRKKGCKFCLVLCKILYKFDEKHCRNSIETDEGYNSVYRQ